jgi:hypothetical protein
VRLRLSEMRGTPASPPGAGRDAALPIPRTWDTPHSLPENRESGKWLSLGFRARGPIRTLGPRTGITLVIVLQ